MVPRKIFILWAICTGNVLAGKTANEAGKTAMTKTGIMAKMGLSIRGYSRGVRALREDGEKKEDASETMAVP